MKRAIRAYGRYVALIISFAAAAILVGGYIIIQQRFQLPFQQRYTLAVEFPNSEALTPGLGQPANVAGVKVGQISSSTLENGRSLVRMSIDPAKLKHVYANAQASLFANTPLDDMEINIAPGGPPAPVLKPGSFIPVAQTQTPIASDQLLHSLDADSRLFFTNLIAAVGTGLDHRGPDLRALLRTLGPTSVQVRELSVALARRRVQLERVVHNLSVVAGAAAQKDHQIGQVLTAGDQTLAALATQDTALSRSIALLPGTLAAAHHSLLTATAFAGHLGPTLSAIEPATKKLPGALASGSKLLNAAYPVLHRDVRPFVRAALPVFANLLPTTRNLFQATPDLTHVAQILQYLTNELLYNQGGAAKSYLFWLSWFAHNANSNLSTADGFGSSIRGILSVSCSSITGNPALQAVAGLFANLNLCA